MEANLYSRGVGLNNKTAPHRLAYDPETGTVALEEAKNVLVDRTGEIVTLRGTALVLSGPCHSSYPSVGGFYFVQENPTDTTLAKAVFDASGALNAYTIRTGMAPKAKVSYTPLDGRILFTNGAEHGAIRGGTFEPWPANIWPGKDKHSFITFPVCKHIETFSGRILGSKGPEVYFSEFGLPGIMDELKNRVRFENDVIMIAAVENGVFMSDRRTIYFISGKDPNKWQAKKATADYPAIEYGRHNQLVDPKLFGVNSEDPAVLFATVQGPVLGLSDGSITNLINENVVMPSECGLQTGSIMIVDETTIIQSGK